MLSILTFNAALLDVRFFSRSVYCPVDSVDRRLPGLIKALLSLQPDIIFLQEIFHYDLQNLIHEQLAGELPYVTGLSRPGVKLRLGNELLTLSRFPAVSVRMVRFEQAALEEKIFTSKGFYHSSVTIPGLGRVDLINFHTTAGGVHFHPEHDRMENVRYRQIEQILAYARFLDMVILAGDLNAGPHTSMNNYQQVIDAGYIDSFIAAGSDGITWDPDNPLVANGREQHLPAQKIDHIFISSTLSKLIIPVESAIVLDGRDATDAHPGQTLSDHYGVMTRFDNAVQF